MNRSFLDACRVLCLEIRAKGPDNMTDAEVDFMYHFMMLPEVQRVFDNANSR